MKKTLFGYGAILLDLETGEGRGKEGFLDTDKDLSQQILSDQDEHRKVDSKTMMNVTLKFI